MCVNNQFKLSILTTQILHMKYSIQNILYCTVLTFSVAITCSCNDNHPKIKTKSQTNQNKPPQINIVILPLGNVPEALIKEITPQFRKVSSNVQVLNSVNLPKLSYYQPRDRYRADSLISWLGRKAKPNQVYVGITTVDISTTNEERGVDDWGVMGLGFCPGNACVISNKRLKDKSANGFFKVVIHEVGHTSGLSHCPTAGCYMRDAEGGDHTADENGFCEKCTTYLRTKGWNI